MLVVHDSSWVGLQLVWGVSGWEGRLGPGRPRPGASERRPLFGLVYNWDGLSGVERRGSGLGGAVGVRKRGPRGLRRASPPSSCVDPPQTHRQPPTNRAHPRHPQVLNYDVPNHIEDYVHRVGRTGRAGERPGFSSVWRPGLVAPLWQYSEASSRLLCTAPQAGGPGGFLLPSDHVRSTSSPAPSARAPLNPPPPSIHPSIHPSVRPRQQGHRRHLHRAGRGALRARPAARAEGERRARTAGPTGGCRTPGCRVGCRSKSCRQ